MQAIILAGGEGTRLRPLTNTIPKPMLPIMNQPMLSYTIEWLKRYGITEIGITLHYRPEAIYEYFGDGSRFGVHITYFTEKEPLGTAGSVKLAESFLDETFFVVSGDAITDINLSDALKFHQQKRSDATLVVNSSENPPEFGSVIAASDGSVLHFMEKPDWDEVCTDMVNTGIYIFEKSIFSAIPSNRFYDFSRDVFPGLLRHGKRVFACHLEGYWRDVGNISAYQRCHKDIFDRKISLGINEEILESGILLGSNCKIDSSALLSPYCVLGDNVVIAEGTSIKDCIIWSNAKIEKNARLYQTVVCSGRSVAPTHLQSSEKLSHNKISGIMHSDITAEFAVRLSSAFASVLGKGSKIVLSFPDYPNYMGLKFAMLSGLIYSGAKVYNLCGVNERGAAKYAVRHLHADGALIISVEKEQALIELLGANSAPASKTILRSVRYAMDSGVTAKIPPDETLAPVNVKDISDYYLKDVLSYTHYKRLNFTVGICSNSQALRDTLKRLGSMLGIVFLFTNEPSHLPELTQSHNLDFALEISDDGQCRLTDDTGRSLSNDQYWGLVTLITLSAVHGSGVYVPTEASEIVNIVARSLGGSVIRVNRRELESQLLTQNTPVSHLQYALCFDAIRAAVRICEFLYLNNCTLSEVLRLMPVMHKISRSIECPSAQKGQVMRQLIETSDSAEIETNGGVFVRSGSSRIYIAPDEKEEKIHIIAESKNADYALEAADDFCGALEKFLH